MTRLSLKFAVVSTHFVFTCKKTRRDAPGVFDRERLGQRVQQDPELVYVLIALGPIGHAPIVSDKA